jgi:hypothetical protein
MIIFVSLIGLIGATFGRRLKRGPALTTSPADA